MKQTCILILGMHRSGTSALTGMLSLLDIYLGSELMEGTCANEKGYFENDILYKINEDLLSQINSSWDDVFYNEVKVESLKDAVNLKNFIKSEFEYADVFAIKDPRLVFLFPVYEKVLNELGVDVKVIVPYRNPVEVASSLHKRDGMSMEKGMLLWAYHFLLAEKFSKKYKRVFLSFDDLMTDPEKVLNDISAKLSLDLADKYSSQKKEISEFLDPGLKHHNISIENLSVNVPDIIKDMLSLRGGFNNDDLSEKFDVLRTKLFTYQRLFYHNDIVSSLNNAKSAKHAFQEKSRELNEANKVLNKKNSELNQALQKKTRELEQAKYSLRANEAELDQLINAKAESDRQLDKTEKTLRLNESELHQASQDLHDRIKVINGLKKELTNVYMSKSWKVTRILRNFKKVIRK